MAVSPPPPRGIEPFTERKVSSRPTNNSPPKPVTTGAPPNKPSRPRKSFSASNMAPALYPSLETRLRAQISIPFSLHSNTLSSTRLRVSAHVLSSNTWINNRLFGQSNPHAASITSPHTSFSLNIGSFQKETGQHVRRGKQSRGG